MILSYKIRENIVFTTIFVKELKKKLNQVDFMAIWQYSRIAILEESMKTKEDYKREVEILKALANEARLMIVDLLKDRTLSVGELTELVELDQSTVSKHLSVLYNAGIVDYKKTGNIVHYRLLTPCVIDAFNCVCNLKRGVMK